MIKSMPTFDHEQLYWKQGIQHIAGVDEAGMGALAGPVYAAAVILSPNAPIDGLRDSKTLSPKKRLELVSAISRHAAAWSYAYATVEEITTLNIRSASHLAMRRAVDSLTLQPDMLLIDGTECQPHNSIPAVSVIDGDALSYSIAAASIIAKEMRDAAMGKLDAQYPAYGFASHKGYGTKVHMEALRTHGPCKHHRATYAPIARLLRTV